MILREATIQYAGYDPSILKPKSNKRICCSCDNCGRIRWVNYYQYKLLCKLCSNKQKNQPPKPKPVSEQNRFIPETGIDRILTIEKFGYDPIDLKKGSQRKVCVSCDDCGCVRYVVYKSYLSQKYPDLCNSCSKSGLNHPNWVNGIRNRNHILPISKCIQLNKRFKKSHGHHLNKNIIIFIPKELHYHIKHNLKTGQGMGEMNILAYQFINGELD